MKLIILTPDCLIFLAHCRTLTTMKFGKEFRFSVVYFVIYSLLSYDSLASNAVGDYRVRLK